MTMHAELDALAREVGLDSRRHLQIAFGLACVQRVRHLIVDEMAIGALDAGLASLSDERVDEPLLADAARTAAAVARSHPGSGVIDGAGSAAVSATTGLAHALAGNTLEAAGYCAYAAVYASSASTVTDIAAYADEHRWQRRLLARLARADACG